VASPDPARIEHLVTGYTDRFSRDFHASAPPPDRPID
jgi:hypothetical protein